MACMVTGAQHLHFYLLIFVAVGGPAGSVRGPQIWTMYVEAKRKRS